MAVQVCVAGLRFVSAGPSCLDRRRKKFQEDSEKKRLRSLPKRIRTLGDAATDAFLNAMSKGPQI